MAPPQPPQPPAAPAPGASSILSEAAVASSSMDAHDAAEAAAAAQQPRPLSGEKHVQIISSSGGPPHEDPHGPDRPPSFLDLGSFTMMNARKQSFYENHYNRRWDNFRGIEFKSWEEVGSRLVLMSMCVYMVVACFWKGRPPTHHPTKPNPPQPTPTQMKWQAHLERALFRHEWRWIVGILAAEYFNLIMHNLVYWCVRAGGFCFDWDIDRGTRPGFGLVDPTRSTYRPFNDLYIETQKLSQDRRPGVEEDRHAPATGRRRHHAVRWPPGRRGLAAGALPLLPDRDGCVLRVVCCIGVGDGYVPSNHHPCPHTYKPTIPTVLALCLGRQLLNNVPWGCPQVELYKKTPTGTKVSQSFVDVCLVKPHAQRCPSVPPHQSN